MPNQKNYIPWFVDSALMETRIMWEKMITEDSHSQCLKLSQVLKLILDGCDSNEYVFQTIDQNGFINNEYPDEILSVFGGWVMLSEGVIIQYGPKLQDMPKPENVAIGYSSSEKFTICPCTAELLQEIADSALEIVNPLRFKVVEYEDITFLSHLSEDEKEAS